MGRVTATVAIALGANLGDRRAHLQEAADRLSTVLDDVRVSTLIETEPVDVAESQPPYLNGVLVGTTALAPRALLDTLMTIERDLGRVRTGHHAARTIDLDLILYGAVVLDEPGLIVPHPRFRDRAFVLGPLAEVAPDLVDPVTGLTVRELARPFRAG